MWFALGASPAVAAPARGRAVAGTGARPSQHPERGHASHPRPRSRLRRPPPARAVHAVNAARVAAALVERAEEVCLRYLPHGRRSGRYWVAGDVRGARGRSLFVRPAPAASPATSSTRRSSSAFPCTASPLDAALASTAKAGPSLGEGSAIFLLRAKCRASRLGADAPSPRALALSAPTGPRVAASRRARRMRGSARTLACSRPSQSNPAPSHGSPSDGRHRHSALVASRLRSLPPRHPG